MKPKKIRLFDLLGTIPPEVYLDVVDSKYPDKQDLCRQWKVRKKYFIDIIKKRYRNQLPIFGELSALVGAVIISAQLIQRNTQRISKLDGSFHGTSHGGKVNFYQIYR